MKIHAHTNTSIQMFIVKLLISAQKWKQPRCPSTSEWLKMDGYLYNGIWLSNKRKLTIMCQHGRIWTALHYIKGYTLYNFTYQKSREGKLSRKHISDYLGLRKFRMMGILIIMIIVTQLYHLSKTYRRIHLQAVNFMVCKLYHNGVS